MNTPKPAIKVDLSTEAMPDFNAMLPLVDRACLMLDPVLRGAFALELARMVATGRDAPQVEAE